MEQGPEDCRGGGSGNSSGSAQDETVDSVDVDWVCLSCRMLLSHRKNTFKQFFLQTVSPGEEPWKRLRSADALHECHATLIVGQM